MVTRLRGDPDRIAWGEIGRAIDDASQGNRVRAITSLTHLIESEDTPDELVAFALFIRGALTGDQGDFVKAIPAATRVIQSKGTPRKKVGRA